VESDWDLVLVLQKLGIFLPAKIPVYLIDFHCYNHTWHKWNDVIIIFKLANRVPALPGKSLIQRKQNSSLPFAAQTTAVLELTLIFHQFLVTETENGMTCLLTLGSLTTFGRYFCIVYEQIDFCSQVLGPKVVTNFSDTLPEQNSSLKMPLRVMMLKFQFWATNIGWFWNFSGPPPEPRGHKLRVEIKESLWMRNLCWTLLISIIR